MLAPGTKLGPYEITGLVGVGGMGEVYRALDSRLRRAVAVKVIRGALAADPERRERFELEARATGALNHPNVLAIYDIGAHDGAPYLVSELLEGETVRLILVRGKMPPTKALSCAVQIAEGLAAAHDKGIIHRDLKPENLFVTRDGRVKILDFGLAKLTQPGIDGSVDSRAPTADTTGPTIGTVSYMSPEQIRGQPVDHRSDVFSFGVVLYEMLVGRRAFHGDSAIETMNAALKEDPEELSLLPPGLDLIVQHCIEKDAGHRFQSAQDLAFHLRALTMGSSTGKKSLPLPPPPSRRGPKVRGIAGALAAAAVVALAAGLFPMLRTTTPPTFRQLTFGRGMVLSARFAGDGQTVVYGAAWDGLPLQLFSMHPESTESRNLGLPDGDILSVSPSGELAVSVGRRSTLGMESTGTLARVSISGGIPRQLLTDVESADWMSAGQALAAIHVVEDRYRIEAPLGKVLYESPAWLSDIRVSRNGSHIAFVEHPLRADDEGDVCVIDVDGTKKRVLSPGWSSVTGITWSKNDREIWFTGAARGARTSLSAVDLSGRKRLVLETPGRLALGDLREGRGLLIDNRLRLHAAFRKTDQPQERDLSWLDGSVGADLSDDGRLLLIAEQGTDVRGVYLRPTDGSAPVRLGDGTAQALSPDGTFAAAITQQSTIVLLPTGPGENRTLPPGPVAHITAVSFFPDGKRVLFAGSEPGKGSRLFVQDIDQGHGPKPVSPEGIRIPFPSRAVSPDGSRAFALDRSRQVLTVALAGQEGQVVPGTRPGDVPIRWSSDGAEIFVFRRGELPAQVRKIDFRSGKETVVLEVSPSDRAGVRPPFAIQLTSDSRQCVYSFSQTLSDLYMVEGLK